MGVALCAHTRPCSPVRVPARGRARLCMARAPAHPRTHATLAHTMPACALAHSLPRAAPSPPPCLPCHPQNFERNLRTADNVRMLRGEVHSFTQNGVFLQDGSFVRAGGRVQVWVWVGASVGL